MISFHIPELKDEKEDFDFCFDLFENTAFQTYLSRNLEIQRGINLGHMVQASFFLVRNTRDELVGRVSIRHRLNSHLLSFGGHIGYAVLPNFRKNGYATQILKRALIFLKNNTIETKALLTCNSLNQASIKTILKNNGVLEDQVQHETRLTNRYWIEL